MHDTCILRWFAVLILVQPGLPETDWRFAGPNLAQGKAARQGPETFLQYYSKLAVDGNVDNNIEHNHCSHTGSSNNAWWKVELGNRFVVKAIRIYNRSNNFGRLVNFRIFGNPGNVELYNDGKADALRYLEIVIEITVDVNTAFDEIVFTIPGPYLTLCEVQVFAALCPLPQLPTNSRLQYQIVGDIVYGGYIPVGSKLLFHCEPSIQYGLVGSAYQTCQADGSYTETLPRCEHFCLRLPGVAYGRYTNVKNSYIPGDFLWVICDNNFAPRSDSKQICTANSTWSNPRPGCSAVSCSSPSRLPNGHYVLSSGSDFPVGGVSVGTAISVVCDQEGFVPIYPTRTCAADGSWTGKGQCIMANDIKCSLDKPYGSSIAYNQSINAHCEPGYMKTSGDESRTCLANGTLSGAELLCIATTCTMEHLHPKERFYFFDDNYGPAVDYSKSITTACRPGYVWSDGDLTRTCLANGSFSGTELLCSKNSQSIGRMYIKTPSIWKGWHGTDVNECENRNGGCDHICTNTQRSFTCSCRTGFLLLSDLKTCSDINECESWNGGCEQICINTQGSFKCSCRSSFYLTSDLKSCSARKDLNVKTVIIVVTSTVGGLLILGILTAVVVKCKRSAHQKIIVVPMNNNEIQPELRRNGNIRTPHVTRPDGMPNVQ